MTDIGNCFFTPSGTRINPSSIQLAPRRRHETVEGVLHCVMVVPVAGGVKWRDKGQLQLCTCDNQRDKQEILLDIAEMSKRPEERTGG